MNYTNLFAIEWDNSHNDPDYRIPGSISNYLDGMGLADRERLAKMLEFLAKAIRNRTVPFEPRSLESRGF